MPRRVITLLLAVVLFWSGLSTFEAPSVSARPSSDDREVVALVGGQSAVHEGSVEDHHLDDLPSQSPNDPSTDTPGLLPTPLAVTAPMLAVARKQALASTSVVQPCLAGPLRPPRDDTIEG